ncbi:MAG: hypothetical protein KGN76_10015 [Acidobacteriota bacterium]|nr:hypothetical protein [Acidobacteriota bacterium]
MLSTMTHADKDDPRRAELERLSTDEGLGVHYDAHGNSWLASGESALSCTACAELVIELSGGRGSIYGWADRRNLTARVALGPGHPAGHDFAVIDDRYLVDPWAAHVEISTPCAVFDLDDAGDRAAVRHFFGDPATWTVRTEQGFVKGAPRQLMPSGATNAGS